MGSFAYKKAPPRLLVIDCAKSNDGVFYHNVYQGRLLLKSMGFDVIITDHFWLDSMRKAPEEFLLAYMANGIQSNKIDS